MTVTRDNVAKVLAAIQRLAARKVLVGIPASEAERQDGEPINNAQLGYIHEYGAPASNIPARPFLVPGVAKQQKAITQRLQKAAKAAMDGNGTALEAELGEAGLIGQNGARERINNGPHEPLSPATVRGRSRSRGTRSMRDGEEHYLQLIDSGMAPEQAQQAAGIQPLINTGKLRNALTYVIRKKE